MKTTVEMSSDNMNVVRRVQYVWIVGEDYAGVMVGGLKAPAGRRLR
jgi:hypothetical protein